MSTPCNACPFTRAIAPGETGGSPPYVYVGQAAGPFFLPCHKSPEYGPGDARHGLHHKQCVGAAIYRANTGVSSFLPPALLRAEPDTVAVFATPAELIAHHAEVPVSVTEAFLDEHPVAELCARQRERSTNTHYAVANISRPQ